MMGMRILEAPTLPTRLHWIMGDGKILRGGTVHDVCLEPGWKGNMPSAALRSPERCSF